MEHLAFKRKLVIMFAIMAAMLFAALNQTIIGPALPRIVADLGDMEYMNWVFTVFMLASSISAVLVGKLSDTYGRKPFILFGLGIFTLGSFLCGWSTTMFQLIMFRALQGIGGGMIMSTAFTAVGDLFAPRERGRWQGMMGSVFGLASIIGPTLGGYLVDTAQWNWIFWIFLPFGLVAFSCIWFLFPKTERGERKPVDYVGSIFLTLTLVPLLVGFSWAGVQYAWTSPVILGLFSASLVSLILFIMTERRVENPVLPLHLFSNSVFSISNAVGFMIGVGMFSALMYTPFFLQGVLGTSALISGFVMIPMTLSMVTASTLCGQWMTRKGTYKSAAFIGLALMAVGMLAMSFMHAETSIWLVVMCMIAVGSGLGTTFPIFTLTIQNAVSYSHLGVATASAQLFRQMGGTVGVGVMGTFLNISLAQRVAEMEETVDVSGTVTTDEFDQVREHLGTTADELHNPEVLMDPNQVHALQEKLPEGLYDAFEGLIALMRAALSDSLSIVFICGAVIMVIAFVTTIFLKELPLRTSNKN